MKIICAGLPKTGTKSIVTALRRLGYIVYDSPEHALFHKEQWAQILEGKVSSGIFRSMYEHVDGVADAPSCAFWEHILEEFPDAKVILTVRDNEDQWYNSFCNHFHKYAEIYPLSKNSERLGLLTQLASWELHTHWKTINNGFNACFGFQCCADNTNEMLARSSYRKHNAYVRSRCSKEQLLEFNVKDGWKPLCDFLSCDVPQETQFPHVNKNASVFTTTESEMSNLVTLKRRLQWQLYSGLSLKAFVLLLIIVVFCAL